jgi:hypothetical protein
LPKKGLGGGERKAIKNSRKPSKYDEKYKST